MSWKISRKTYQNRLASALIYDEAGKITKSIGLVFEAHLPGASIGSLCKIYPNPDLDFDEGVDAEVIGFKESNVILMPFEEVRGTSNDSLVVLKKRSPMIFAGDALLGRVIDGKGDPLDTLGPISLSQGNVEERSLYQKPADPVLRDVIQKPLELGVRSIDGFITCGRGQRIGILAGSGVGKSVLMGMIARNTEADVNVIALVGERGREVREFIERDLGEEGKKKSVVVVATSDASPLLRMRSAFLASTIAEYFRDQGKNVLLLMDSVTRFAMAQRELGLSLGEPPATKGYTPSVFSTLPKLFERAGTSVGKGSITGIYTVLAEGDDLEDPIVDSSKSILDGHIVLSRDLAERGHFPAIDVLQSTSRVMSSVISKEHRSIVTQLRESMAIYRQSEDLINIGAYVRGSNIKIDQAIVLNERLNQFLRQGIEESSSFSDTVERLRALSQLLNSVGGGFDAEKSAQSQRQNFAPLGF